ncbi:MAG: hypothetical protein ISR50_05785 [Alphaproteobacteria bacterium]|nr:hypothetical protein [Alphaproteobacteria bacterium]MBL6952121.1 hypothetical protein [Alphaproteobacteria bacterium]
MIREILLSSFGDVRIDHRFLDNERVNACGIVDSLAARTSQACEGRRIIAVQDTTEVNFSGRDKGRRDLVIRSAHDRRVATRILQLTDARDGSSRPASDALDKDLVKPAALIAKTLEGKTKRQQNPYDEGGLSWLAWIVARLGGWNCYYKPPGLKTMAIGWKELASMLAGIRIAQQVQDV